MIYLMGGLGNRLFQYYEFIRMGKKFALCSYLTRYNLSTWFLGWTIHENTRIDTLFNAERGTFFMFVAHYLLNKFKLRKSYFEYFQPLKWDDATIEELRAKILPEISMIASVNCVLHYRGTDSEWANEINNYYSQILNLQEDFILVTDDNVLAEQILNLRLPYVCRSLEEDFSLMLAAKVLVVGPSTLSWWAAILSKSVETVYMPRFVYDKLGFPDQSKKLIVLD
jgi:hypothetical protein